MKSLRLVPLVDGARRSRRGNVHRREAQAMPGPLMWRAWKRRSRRVPLTPTRRHSISQVSINAWHRNPSSRLAAGARGLAFGCFALVVFSFAAEASAQTLQDYFTNRLTFTNRTGQIVQNNATATVEVNEPKHGGKTGGHSLWMSWVAVTNGIVTFKTETSGFDTLLSAYQFTTTNGSTFAELREVARSDDAEGLERESKIQFGVVAGQRFEVAVDGYFGAVGQVDFQWEFKSLSAPPPLLLTTLADRSVNIGDTVSLAFAVTNAAAGGYKWYLNGNELDGVNTTNLTIASFSVTNVGRYTMLVDGGGGAQYFSVPVEIQINTEGFPNTLAQNKFRDSPSTPLIGIGGSGSPEPIGGKGSKPPAAGPAGVVRGYSGSQIFSTVNATTDPLEPAHCNAPGGKSYWLVYQPPANGTITLDTLGSTYDTVMETYTYNGTPTGYADLISIACNNNIAGTNGPSRVQFAMVKTRQYLIAVDGVGGATGTARLNYNLNTNQPPQSPALTGAPAPVIVAAGASMVLTAPVIGSPPLTFTWRKNGALLPGATAPALALDNVTANDTGSYSFTVTNDLGGVSGIFAVKVLVPMQCSLARIAGGFQMSFLSLTGLTYTIEDSTNLPGDWTPWPGSLVGNGLTNYFNVGNTGRRFFRVRVE